MQCESNLNNCMFPMVSLEALGTVVDNSEVPLFFYFTNDNGLEKTVNDLGFKLFNIPTGKTFKGIDIEDKDHEEVLYGYSKYSEDELKGSELDKLFIYYNLKKLIDDISFTFSVNRKSLQYNSMNNVFRSFIGSDALKDSDLTKEDIDKLVNLELTDHYGISDFIKEEINALIEKSDKLKKYLYTLRTFSNVPDAKFKDSSREAMFTPPYKENGKIVLEHYLTFKFGKLNKDSEEYYCRIKIKHFKV